MSGSQPATVGELHPLHRNALRHPLILDGLSDSASRLRPPPPFGFGAPSCSASSRLCLHVLSSFQRTGLARYRGRAGARSRMRSPSGVSPLGEPYNLTSAFLFVSTPVVVFRRRHIAPEERDAPKNGLGVVRARRIAEGSGHGPGHARSNKYTRRLGRCQPRSFQGFQPKPDGWLSRSDRISAMAAPSRRADPCALSGAGSPVRR